MRVRRIGHVYMTTLTKNLAHLPHHLSGGIWSYVLHKSTLSKERTNLAKLSVQLAKSSFRSLDNTSHLFILVVSSWRGWILPTEMWELWGTVEDTIWFFLIFAIFASNPFRTEEVQEIRNSICSFSETSTKIIVSFLNKSVQTLKLYATRFLLNDF